MSETFLEKILETTRQKVTLQRERTDVRELRAKAFEIREQLEKYRFSKTLSDRNRINIIAEIKRASPSKGTINDSINVTETAKAYKAGGACAISILTEEQFFKGSLDDLRVARDAVDLPILRKDFIVDDFQIYEAAAAGADAILLIVAALGFENLRDFQTLARELGLDALVEVHTAAELEIATEIGARLVGVNNRDLRSFDVSLDISRELIKHRPTGALMIAESGLSKKEEILELRSLGFDGFLVGETLMRAGNAVQTLEALV
jgi:indole-3-glycerol phosphate synthase